MDMHNWHGQLQRKQILNQLDVDGTCFGRSFIEQVSQVKSDIIQSQKDLAIPTDTH